jgi:uncharacterized protein (TIGR03083 family)
MAKVELWPVVRQEREALASDLQAISEEMWSAGSWCSQWSVRDVLAHMTATAKISPVSFFPKLISSGCSFDRLQAKDIAAERGSSPEDGLSRFQAIVGSTKRPPGPSDSILGETIIHGEDIRRPLGISHEYPMDALTQVADFYKGSNLIIGTKRRIEGVTLKATDASWSHGSGPEVSGPMVSILMAMTGRMPALEALSGDGVSVLRNRA